MNSASHFLPSLANSFWLRPESALIYSMYLEWLSPELPLAWERPSLDLVPQDGLVSSAVVGRQLPLEVDVYGYLDTPWSLHPSAAAHLVANGGPTTAISGERASGEGRFFDVGVDFEERFLKQARALGIHRTQILAHGRRLPFPDRSFATIWALQFYWLPDRSVAAQEVFRLTREGGRAYVYVPSQNASKWALEHWSWNGQPLPKSLGGRLSHYLEWQGSVDMWSERFASVGFVIDAVHPVVPKWAFLLYEVGLRPLAAPLLQWRRTLLRRPNDFSLAKREYVSYLLEALMPAVESMEPGARSHLVFELRRP